MDYELPIERLARWLCDRFGHYVVEEKRGEPVTLFQLCLRCGKYGR